MNAGNTFEVTEIAVEARTVAKLMPVPASHD